MPQINNEIRKSDLALALAGGGTVKDFAASHQIPTSTAYHWARESEVIEQVQAIRAEVMDRAIGLLSEQAPAAVMQIIELAKGADSESVRLQASRAVLNQMISVSNHVTLERRMAGIERRIREEMEARGEAPGPMTDPSLPTAPSATTN